jgi:hypothetical protein
MNFPEDHKREAQSLSSDISFPFHIVAYYDHSHRAVLPKKFSLRRTFPTIKSLAESVSHNGGCQAPINFYLGPLSPNRI